MKKLFNKLYKKRIFRLAVFPLGLLGLWLLLTFLYILTFDTSLTVISVKHNKDSFDRLTYNKIHKGDKISGHFTASEDNLGIVSVKFQTFIRPPYKEEDHLVFRFKEKGAKQWYVQNKYRDGLIYDVPVFPFGIPKIADSKGKTYQFEVESLNGNDINSVAISKKGQVLFSKYQVPKSMLLHDKKEFAIFIYKKFMSSMLSTDVRLSSFIYLLPFIYYLIYISPLKKNKSIYVAYLILVIAILDIFHFQLNNDLMYIVVVFMWIVLSSLYKIKNKNTFIFALSLLILPPIMLSFRDEPTAEKAAIWAYMFLVAGTLQILIALRDHKNDEKI